MDIVKLITDPYDRKARLYPALFILLPTIVTTYVLMNEEKETMKSLFAIIVWVGGAFFLTQIARDNGKKKEPALFQVWGGMPSVVIFRHRDTQLDSITKQRYRKAMTDLVSGSTLYSTQEENEKPDEADKTYLAWSNYLRTQTRDKERFNLIFIENINYGYRRNMWGMKTWGITLCVLNILSCAIRPIYRYFWLAQKIGLKLFELSLLVSILLSICFLMFWIFQVNEDWVKIPADSYAIRLIESIDKLVVNEQ